MAQPARKILSIASVLSLSVATLGIALRVRAQASRTELSVPEWEVAAGGEKQQFVVATVKPSAAGTSFESNVSLDGADGPPVGGLFRANAPLMGYLLFAFKISDSNEARSIYDKLPVWAKAPHFFEIEARADGNPTRDQLRLMMQALLADRFKLKMHREMQPRAVYALALDKPRKEGPRLQPHPTRKTCVNNPTASVTIEAPVKGAEAPFYCGMVSWRSGGQENLQFVDMPMAQIANYLASEAVLATGARVPHSGLDSTGLTGRFDMQLQFVPEPNGPGSNPDISGPRFIEALKEQLGLRLIERTAPVQVLVIDHIEKLSNED